METDPGGVMERQLVEAYLRTQGHTLRSARDLPEAPRRSLLAAAARYASLQMTDGDTDDRRPTPVTTAVPETMTALNPKCR